MSFRDAKGGFTLTELLVSTAIFAILMTSIGALFVASLHAVRAGYQSQEAFETARGTFNVLERDLTTVFTSRDFGQYYQFYGNEYGMMMVGLLQLRDSSGREYSRIGRITYVMYPVVLRGADLEPTYYVTEPFALDYAKRVGVTDVGRAPDFHKTRGVRYSGDDPNSDMGSTEVGICALVRYVEPGVSDLDSYPFDWNVLIDETENNPEFPSGNNPQSLREQLDASLEASALTGNQDPSSEYRLLARLDTARDQMLAAKKRDLWLRMLSCQKYWIPKLVGGAALLPNPWGRIDSTGNVTERCWLQGGSTVSVVNPRDYIAVDNIGIYTPQTYWTTWPLLAYRPNGGYKPFFEYGRVASDATVDLMPFWNSNRLSYGGDCSLLPAGYDYDQDGVVGEFGERLVVPGTTDPGMLVIDPNAYERDGRDNNANGTIDEPGEDFVNPVQVLIENDNRDNDGNGAVDEAGETIGLDNASQLIELQLPDPFVSYGSPLQPRLPEAVMVRIPMVFSAAYVKAPNFERSMEQLIDVPTAYTRSKLAYEQP